MLKTWNAHNLGYMVEVRVQLDLAISPNEWEVESIFEQQTK
jgi:hypothetical protein